MTEGGDRQNPPTHTDYEKPKQHQSNQDVEARSATRARREIQNLGSHNSAGTEEIATGQLGRRRKSVSLQSLRADLDFFKQRANDAEEYLPQFRIPGEDTEAKQTFADFKHATDGMKTTGQAIIDKLAS